LDIRKKHSILSNIEVALNEISVAKMMKLLNNKKFINTSKF